MVISGVNRVTLQSGAALRLPWHLRAGQMVLVEMLAITGPEAVVRVAGQTFNARGELPSAAANFWALVEEINGDTLNLRRLSSGVTEELFPEDIARLLDLPADKDTVRLLGEMLKKGLPLERQMILRFLAEGKALPENERDAFWAARLYLETLDLREAPEKFRLAVDYLLQRNDAAPQGQEALNSAQALIPGQELLRFFTFTGREVFGELYVIYKDGNAESQGTTAGLAIQVNSPRLGQTWVYLEESLDGLTVRVVVAGEQFLQPASATVETLSEKLTALGYRVNQVTAVARMVRDVFDLIKPSEAPGYRSLNTVV
ncbi:MAG: hypothetical protein AB1500_10175 [Bacillota bacterium]